MKSRKLVKNTDDVAIVGISCRLPGISTVDDFWNLLVDERSVAGDHLETLDGPTLEHHYDKVRNVEGKNEEYFYDPYTFDNHFFGVPDLEAQFMDPHQKLALELSWAALEDANFVPSSSDEGERVGVFVGSISNDYVNVVTRLEDLGKFIGSTTATARSMIANKVSFFCGFTGPSLVVDSGQSSSLVAVSLALDSIRSGESSCALVGGVHLNLSEDSERQLDKLGVLSPSGICSPFDAQADGIVRGEGGGFVFLKPYDRALEDGDSIYAVIKGASINNNGSSDSIFNPSISAQKSLVNSTIESADIPKELIQYMELHGTGTQIGDTIELQAVEQIFGGLRFDGAKNKLFIGSVKSNIGHLEGAAGIFGLIKTALIIERGYIPPTLNFNSLPSGVNSSYFQVLDRGVNWAGDRPRIASVSSLGLGGLIVMSY